MYILDDARLFVYYSNRLRLQLSQELHEERAEQFRHQRAPHVRDIE